MRLLSHVCILSQKKKLEKYKEKTSVNYGGLRGRIRNADSVQLLFQKDI
jgi:hypothetical protein